MEYLVLALLCAFLALMHSASASESVFCGRALAQKPIKEVQVPCPENSVCFGSWTRWEIRPEQLLSGDEVPARVMAAAIQSSHYTPKYEASIRLFTVKPIEDPVKRKLLGADFMLIKWSTDADAPSCVNTQTTASANGK